MNTKFSKPCYVTTSKRLKNLLMKCKRCWKITSNGSFIIPIDSLPLLSFTKLPQTKFFIFLHVSNNERSRKFCTGHWLGLAIYLSQRKCLIFDPANQIKQWENTMQIIHEFCNKNKLKCIDFNLKCQDEGSYICGQECLAMCAKMHNNTLRQLLNLRTLLKQYDVDSIENKMVSFAEDHFVTKF